MRNYAKGRLKEQRLVRELSADPACLCCVRSARSLGPWDVIAFYENDVFKWIELIQIKTIKPSHEELIPLEVLASHQQQVYCWLYISNGQQQEAWKFNDDDAKWYLCENGVLSKKTLEWRKYRRKVNVHNHKHGQGSGRGQDDSTPF